MKKTTIASAALAFAGATFMMTREAHALGPIDLEIGAKAGVGTNPLSGKGFDVPNPLGFGLGARAGVDLFGFYGGVQVMYYFGGSQDVAGVGTVKDHTLMYGLDLGYGITILDLLTIRPQLGIGIGNISLSGGGSVATSAGVISFGGSNSYSNTYLEPGLEALIHLGTWYVGADANVLFFPGLDIPSTDNKAAFTFHGQVGVKL